MTGYSIFPVKEDKCKNVYCEHGYDYCEAATGYCGTYMYM